MIAFCLTIVLVISIGNVYIANIVYYFLFLKQLIDNKGKIVITQNLSARIFFVLFIFWATFSTFYYSLTTGLMDSRNLIQYVYTLQYFVLLVPLAINEEIFEKWVYRFSLLFSVLIIGFFMYLLLTTPNFSIALYKDDPMAVKYIPGWPNTTPIPLLIALWISFKNKEFFGSKIILIAAAVLTTSRGAYLGIFLVVGYFILKKIAIKKKYIIFASAGVLVMVLAGAYWLLNHPAYVSQLLRFFDRQDILNTTMAYVELDPLVGYGGNTIAQLQQVVISYQPLRDWGHTHNWVLEILLRYGLMGLTLFIGFIASIWINIKDKDRKLMFAVLLVLAFFQTFIRDFVFLSFLVYLSNGTGSKNMETVKDDKELISIESMDGL